MISMPLLVFFGVSSLSSDQVYVHSASHEPKISPRFAITMRLKTDTTAMWATEATYYNNRLFMVPHLVSAQSAYRDIRICSFHHTHTHTHTHRCMRTHTQTGVPKLTALYILQHFLSFTNIIQLWQLIMYNIQVHVPYEKQQYIKKMNHYITTYP